MKIIYDETQAIKEKEKIDAETPGENRQAKIHNIILAIVLSITSVLLSVIILYLLNLLSNTGIGLISPAFKNMAWIVCNVCLVLIAIDIYIGNEDYKMTAAERYPAFIDYYLATKDKKILSITAIKTDNISYLGDTYDLILNLEDQNHIVTKKTIKLAYFQTQTRTDISEMTIDLHSRTINKPYYTDPNGGNDE